jgi:hypothetical protein
MSASARWLCPTVCCGGAALVVAGEVLAQTDIRDLRPPAPVEGPPSFLLTGLVLALLLAFILFMRRLRSSVPAPLPHALDDETEATREMARLADEYRSGIRSGAMVVGALDMMLRREMAQRLDIPALRLASGELFNQWKAVVADPEGRQGLASFLLLADKVKFAAHDPAPHDVETALRTANILLGSALRKGST